MQVFLNTVYTFCNAIYERRAPTDAFAVFSVYHSTFPFAPTSLLIWYPRIVTAVLLCPFAMTIVFHFVSDLFVERGYCRHLTFRRDYI